MTQSKSEKIFQENQQSNKKMNNEKINNEKLALQKNKMTTIPNYDKSIDTEIKPITTPAKSKLEKNEMSTSDKESDVHLSNYDHWPRNILDIYFKKYPDFDKDVIAKNNHMLSFPTKKSGEEFFNEISKECNTVFFATWVVDGKTQDDHLFSCGTGQVFKGSFAEIHQQLTTVYEGLPEESPNRAILNKAMKDISILMPKQDNTRYLRNAMSELRQTETSLEKADDKTDKKNISQSSTSSSLSK